MPPVVTHRKHSIARCPAGLTKEELRNEYQRIRLEERNWVLSRTTSAERKRIQNLVSAANPQDIEVAFEEIWVAVNERESQKLLTRSVEHQLIDLMEHPSGSLNAALLFWEKNASFRLTPLQRRRVLAIKDEESVSANIELLLKIASSVVAKLKAN